MDFFDDSDSEYDGEIEKVLREVENRRIKPSSPQADKEPIMPHSIPSSFTHIVHSVTTKGKFDNSKQNGLISTLKDTFLNNMNSNVPKLNANKTINSNELPISSVHLQTKMNNLPTNSNIQFKPNQVAGSNLINNQFFMVSDDEDEDNSEIFKVLDKLEAESNKGSLNRPTISNQNNEKNTNMALKKLQKSVNNANKDLNGGKQNSFSVSSSRMFSPMQKPSNLKQETSNALSASNSNNQPNTLQSLNVGLQNQTAQNNNAFQPPANLHAANTINDKIPIFEISDDDDVPHDFFDKLDEISRNAKQINIKQNIVPQKNKSDSSTITNSANRTKEIQTTIGNFSNINQASNNITGKSNMVANPSYSKTLNTSNGNYQNQSKKPTFNIISRYKPPEKCYERDNYYTPLRYCPSAVQTWVYPTNYPVRDYQFNIVQKALHENTLVSLPTGLGKTFIAAVVMFNFYRWFPDLKVVFMAPTKPLVAQQIESCYKVCGISQNDSAELTGVTAPHIRAELWRSKRVFYLTPQILNNDLNQGICSPSFFSLVVVDEAHRGQKSYAYVNVIKGIFKENPLFRVLALSATPGTNLNNVQSMVTNLNIARIEIRTEDAIDISPYTFQKLVDKIVVPLSPKIKEISTKFKTLITPYLEKLKSKGAFWCTDPDQTSNFGLLEARNNYRLRASGDGGWESRIAEGDFALCISMVHQLEHLYKYGLTTFYTKLKDWIEESKRSEAKYRKQMLANLDFQNLFNIVEAIVMEDNFHSSFSSHPKLLHLVNHTKEHFRRHKEESKSGDPDTKVMIFAQFRETIDEIINALSTLGSEVRATAFIGQATGKSGKGLKQKMQIEVIKKFKQGEYNVLVCSSIGEEGLDIGEVDFIICYDSSSSPIRMLQRVGRTGRRRNGKVCMLLTQGKEERSFHSSKSNHKTVLKAIQSGNIKYFDQNARMLPEGVIPVCDKRNIEIAPFVQPTSKNTRTRSPVLENNEDEPYALNPREQAEYDIIFGDNSIHFTPLDKSKSTRDRPTAFYAIRHSYTTSNFIDIINKCQVANIKGLSNGAIKVKSNKEAKKKSSKKNSDIFTCSQELSNDTSFPNALALSNYVKPHQTRSSKVTNQSISNSHISSNKGHYSGFNSMTSPIPLKRNLDSRLQSIFDRHAKLARHRINIGSLTLVPDDIPQPSLNQENTVELDSSKTIEEALTDNYEMSKNEQSNSRKVVNLETSIKKSKGALQKFLAAKTSKLSDKQSFSKPKQKMVENKVDYSNEFEVSADGGMSNFSFTSDPIPNKISSSYQNTIEEFDCETQEKVNPISITQESTVVNISSTFDNIIKNSANLSNNIGPGNNSSGIVEGRCDLIRTNIELPSSSSKSINQNNNILGGNKSIIELASNISTAPTEATINPHNKITNKSSFGAIVLIDKRNKSLNRPILNSTKNTNNNNGNELKKDSDQQFSSYEFATPFKPLKRLIKGQRPGGIPTSLTKANNVPSVLPIESNTPRRNKVTVKEKNKRKQNRVIRDELMELEAEVSGEDENQNDDEEDSFIDDNTQEPNLEGFVCEDHEASQVEFSSANMQAFYRQSLFSQPTDVINSKFKTKANQFGNQKVGLKYILTKKRTYDDSALDQVEEEEEDVDDSFVVDDSEPIEMESSPAKPIHSPLGRTRSAKRKEEETMTTEQINDLNINNIFEISSDDMEIFEAIP